MKSISIKLPEPLLEATRRMAEALGLSRSEYIRTALQEMNRRATERLRVQRLADVSRRVRDGARRLRRSPAAR